MALPKWITPAGQLGIVPELEYYEFPLDAYDASGGTLKYFLVSGRLPLGIQIIQSGKLQGIPISELGGDQNVTYTFTIRVQNVVTGGLSDRTFTLTITNIAPPIINYPTRNSYLGIYLDGAEVDIQLEAIEATPGATLTWTVKTGEIPPGLTLSSSGQLVGYIEPIPSAAPGTTPGWDETVWNTIAWDFGLQAVIKTFTFSIEVFDGVNYDLSTYSIKVFPRSALTADTTGLTADQTELSATPYIPLTTDLAPKHNPIILTKQADLPPVREGSYFSFQVDALDLDSDVVYYSIPALASGAFDEQEFGNVVPSYTYVAASPINNRLTVGLFPFVDTIEDYENDTSYSVADYTQGQLSPGDVIKLQSSDEYWKQATITSNVTVRLSGNTIVSASAGQHLTQASSGADITIAYSSDTTGTLTLAGNIVTGYINTILQTFDITVSANITANVGQFITQTISGANAMVTANVTNSKSVNVLYNSGAFTLGSGNIKIGAANVAAYPTASTKDYRNITLRSNIGDVITQVGSTGSATVTGNVQDAVSIPVVFNSGTFNLNSGNIRINGANANVWISSLTQISNPFAMLANVGEYITQSTTGANAQVTSNVVLGTQIPVKFIANNFSTGSGNIKLNGSNVNAYPSRVVCSTDITGTYNSGSTVDINSALSTAIPAIASVTTNSTISSIVSVGVTLGADSIEGDVGFDSGKYDQGALNLPDNIDINTTSGWITGQLPGQTIARVDYEFEVIAYKRDDPSYQDTQLFVLTVLGDLNNRIDWITPSDLGTIETGKVSDLFIYATSPLNKTIFYELTPESYQKLPQGLSLTLTGLLSGRVSFEVFGLDRSLTTMDGESTTFDFTYTFTVTARDITSTVTADRTFTIKVRQFDKIPYENLYLKALPTREQRQTFEELLSDQSIFPLDKIYRNEDPWFGLATDIRSLFLAGLSPSTLSEYAQSVSTNHFNKRITFDGIKTARALDANFNVKYEVVYVEIFDENTNSLGQGPQNTIALNEIIANPYIDSDGNQYTTAYPNSVENMSSVVVQQLGYENKGALPDWMTSLQADGRQLGFVRAVVLAYTKPGESDLIAYRLRQRDFDFNSIDFTVDRYQLDNVYSTNFDIPADEFITSSETTFDRYPPLLAGYTDAGTVNYAVSVSFEEINGHLVDTVIAEGGLDGYKNFVDGDLLVFAEQEFRINAATVYEYNNGWSDVETLWDEEGNTPWSYDENTADDGTYGGDPTPGAEWDKSTYVPGYNEHNLDPAVINKRIGVWQINISTGGVITLSFVKAINFYDKLYVTNGYTYGGTNIYFDPVVKPKKNIPNYSIIRQQISTVSTRFDGNGTRFLDYRDSYVLPEQGDKYIKFAKTGVFT